VVCEPEAVAAPDVDDEGGVGKGSSVVILGFYFYSRKRREGGRKDEYG
jgi:hypothetical protein